MGKESTIYRNDEASLWCVETIYPSKDKSEIIIDSECYVQFTERPSRVPTSRQWNPMLRDNKGCTFYDEGDMEWIPEGFAVNCKKNLKVSELRELNKQSIINKILKANEKSKTDAQGIAETIKKASL